MLYIRNSASPINRQLELDNCQVGLAFCRYWQVNKPREDQTAYNRDIGHGEVFTGHKRLCSQDAVEVVHSP
jgi:hypothetical protein